MEVCAFRWTVRRISIWPLEREPVAQGDLEPCTGQQADHRHRRGSSIDLTNRILVSVMLANNEVGTIEPAKRIARIAHRHGVRRYVDLAGGRADSIRMRDWTWTR